MHTTTRKELTFLILYGLTTSFYINRLLTRYIFENASKWGWLIIFAISLLMLIISPFIYYLLSKIQSNHIQFKHQSSKLNQFFLYLYLLLSICICLIFLMTLINASWLVETPYTFVLLPFLGILYYVLMQKEEVFLRLNTLFIFPIIIQYIIYLLAKEKSMNIYALIPYNSSIDKLYIILLISLQMIGHLFLSTFYFDKCKQPITKKGFYITLFCILFSLCFDAVIVSGQFGNSLVNFPFIYYESWCLISFGQYVGYLDILSFFYWVSSAFCYVGLCLLLIKQNYTNKLYNGTYVALIIILFIILTHGSLYHYVKPLLLILSTITLLIAVFCYVRKVINYENH